MIKIEFNYDQEIDILEFNSDRKILSICKQYSKLKKININHLGLLFSGKNLNTNEYLGKSLNQILTKYDINDGKIAITVIYSVFDNTSSIYSINTFDSGDDEENNNKNNFKLLIRLYLLFFIEFIIISTIIGICFFFEFNKIFINDEYCIFGISISSILIILIISIFIFFIPRKMKYLIIIYIFHFLYISSIIFICLISSKYIHYKIIMSCLFILNIDILTIGIFILIFKKYNCYGFLFTPFITNTISIVLLYFLWVKDVYQILYISGFSLFIIISHFIITFLLLKKPIINHICEFSFIGIIINLSIFILIGQGIFHLYNYIKSKILIYPLSLRAIYFNVYLILLLEFIFIFVINFLGFYFEFSNIFYYNLTITWISFSSIILFSLFSFILLLYKDIDNDNYNDNYKLLLPIFFIFIPCIIISCFLLSKYIKENIILSFLIIILSNVLSIEFYILLFSNCKKFGILLFSFLGSLISISSIYLFWIKEFNEIFYLIIFGLILLIINYSCLYISFEFFQNNNKFFMIIIMKVFILALLYQFLKFIISVFREDVDDNNIEQKNKYFLFKVNFLLLLEYLINLLFVFIFRDFSGNLNDSFKKNAFYYILFFGFPSCLCNCLFIPKGNRYDNNNECENCIFGISNIMHLPIMITFYIFLYDYINTLYLLSFFVIIIFMFAIFSLPTCQFYRWVFNLFPLLILILLFIIFYSIMQEDSSNLIIISLIFYFYIMIIENVFSNCCNKPVDNYKEIVIPCDDTDDCDNCDEDHCICYESQGIYIRYYNIIFCISFINLLKMFPFSLLYLSVCAFLKCLVVTCCRCE